MGNPDKLEIQSVCRKECSTDTSCPLRQIFSKREYNLRRAEILSQRGLVETTVKGTNGRLSGQGFIDCSRGSGRLIFAAESYAER